MTLLDPSGNPIQSEKAQQENVSRAQQLFELAINFLNDNSVTNDECADLLQNMFSVWCENCAAGLYNKNVTLMMATFAKTAQRFLPLKQAEIKIRKSLVAANEQEKPS